jgi:diguanylate cyclase (GGDEF)-like protein
MLFAKQVVQSLENVLLYDMATVDSLTRVANRGHGLRRLSETLRLASRSGRSTSVAMLDIDHFKLVNDRHGHAAGDVLLRRVGEALVDTCRESDVVVRYGGEEFVVVLPDTDEAGSVVAAERMRRSITDLEVTFEGQRIGVSTSAGVATTRGSGESPASLLQRADQALYQAKATGRDRVCCARDSSAPPCARNTQGAA